MSEKPWYAEGLRFKCTECGKCCTGAPGHVWISHDEIAQMAQFLQISPEEFQQKYVRQVGDRLSLIEDPQNYDCVFLKEGKCQVYGARPTQCRTYPFWPQIMRSPEAWKAEARHCEGINDEAPSVDHETIEEQLIQMRTKT